MYMLLSTFIVLTINTIFIMMNHPLAITMMIILQTLMICLITGSISYSFWFSYILFMIFLGGMLVLFIYITSLASNEMFQLPIKTIMINMIFLIMSLTILYMMKTHLLMMYSYKNDSLMNSAINITMENNNLNQLYNYPNFLLTLMTIIYLLVTLIIIVKITSLQEGPLRSSN